MPVFWNVVWCQWWDADSGMAAGRMHDLGRGTLWEVPALVAEGERLALRMAWGPGLVVVTDDRGVRVDLSALARSG